MSEERFRSLLDRAVAEVKQRLKKHQNPGSHFLDSVESAIAWALKNVGDAEQNYPSGQGADRENGRGWSAAQRDNMEQAVSEYVEEYADTMRRGKATIWRAVRIPAVADPSKWIKWSSVGTHWSFRKNGAGDYGGGQEFDPGVDLPEIKRGESTKVVVIEAVVNAEDIDWEYGFTRSGTTDSSSSSVRSNVARR